MRTIRVIPCLDMSGGRVVKGVNFADLADAGDPVELALTYAAEGADELTFLDISATLQDRSTSAAVLERIAAQIQLPITMGGGIRSREDAARLLGAGAAAVSVSSAALARPELVTELADEFGSAAVMVSVDARRREQGPSAEYPSGFEVTSHGGTRSVGIDAVEWVRRSVELGAGQVLLNSMDGDGTQDGFDLELIAAARAVTEAELIASGGAGAVEHFAPAVEAGATAVLAASVFHFGLVRIKQVKAALQAAGYQVREDV